LNEAIPDLPETVPTNENGRVTKFAAIALLGKVILYQNDDGRMSEAATLFQQVNTSPNYELLTNFGTIFRPDNKFNKESVFEIAHTAKKMAGWDAWPDFEGHVYTQMIGARSYVGPTFKSGWGFNPIIVDFVNIMKASALLGDVRYQYTVIDMSVLQAGGATFSAGYMNTGYFVKKFAPLTEFYPSTGGDPMINWPMNYIEIRLADTYLMEAEALVRGGGSASRAQDLLDAVRIRAGLTSIPATLDNIYNERRLELATEGHRFFDLVRTGQAATALAFKHFDASKNNLLPIPLSELANTKLEQNPNYY